jgi:hypothetical protein
MRKKKIGAIAVAIMRFALLILLGMVVIGTALASARHVLLFADRPRDLGGESARFSHHGHERRARALDRAPDYVLDRRATVVGWNGRPVGDNLFCSLRSGFLTAALRRFGMTSER